jgi:hypothetical protein
LIISASRRTDIPAFYAAWFMNRIRAGYCTVPNPFNPNQVSHVSLQPEDVDVIVLWTRHPRPLFPFLAELDDRGYRYYFLYTLLNYPRLIDPKSPPLDAALKTFRELSGRIGPARVIWRYDPIMLSNLTGGPFHQQTYERIARALKGHTLRSIFSTVTFYRKTAARLQELRQQGVEVEAVDARPGGMLKELMSAMIRIAGENGMEITSCAETLDLQPYAIRPGKCVDDEYITKAFGLTVTSQKDPSQRPTCACVVSRDIGMYDSCTFGCAYCYANKSFELAKLNLEAHDPNSPSLLGWHDVTPK